MGIDQHIRIDSNHSTGFQDATPPRLSYANSRITAQSWQMGPSPPKPSGYKRSPISIRCFAANPSSAPRSFSC